MRQVKEEHHLWEDYKHFGPTQHYEEEIEHVDHYLNQMEKIIREKDDMVTMMKEQHAKMRTEARNAKIMTAQFRQEQEQPRHQVQPSFAPGLVGSRSGNRIHLHSHQNGVHFNGFNGGSMADEQLLEGLGDETRLF
jgi:hypothetical protein